jgi:hypothetical protein
MNSGIHPDLLDSAHSFRCTAVDDDLIQKAALSKQRSLGNHNQLCGAKEQRKGQRKGMSALSLPRDFRQLSSVITIPDREIFLQVSLSH